MTNIRVSSGGDQDATMEDIRVKDRLPGDPPDDLRSWMKKVMEIRRMLLHHG